MRKEPPLPRQRDYAECEKHGFVRAGNNLYRCYGDSLLQVISLPKKSGFVSNADDLNQIHFGVFSLYSELPWIPPGQLPKVIGFDLPATWNPNLFFCGLRNQLENEDSIQMVFDKVIPYLNTMVTHEQLADLLERYDMIDSSQIRLNDGAKIVPYILSRQSEKAIETITAIEEQNWDAYRKNCQFSPSYDEETHRERITTRLAPLIELRKALCSQNEAAVSEYLLANYRDNSCRLRSLGVKPNDSDTVYAFWGDIPNAVEDA